ncbi:DsbA family protein [Flavihumibacter sp. R14]|nr:DsbA family protein [Flavihumibacter soli]
MKPKIIYVYDALCGWCFGFSPVIQAVHDAYRDQFDFEIISGGMMIGDRAGRVADVAPFIRDTYKTVEDTTGIVFGLAFIKNLEEGYMIFNSERPAIALSVCKSLLPKKTFEFATDLQNSIYFDGKEPDHMDLYRYLAANFGIDPDEFASRMDDPVFKDEAHYDFALAKQLQVGSYPAVLIQYADSKFYLIARGYSDYETMELRINNVKKEIGF